MVVADPDDPYKVLDQAREIGLVVARGPSVMLICPMVPLVCAAAAE